jgi:hypothetical protein
MAAEYLITEILRKMVRNLNGRASRVKSQTEMDHQADDANRSTRIIHKEFNHADTEDTEIKTYVTNQVNRSFAVCYFLINQHNDQIVKT